MNPQPPAHAQLLHLLAEGPELEAFLEAAVRVAADNVHSADACGMTLRRGSGSGAFTVAYSDVFASEMDELQYGADEGPCLDALRAGRVVETQDMSAETRWDQYRSHALKHGVAASLSYPLTVDGQVAAVLNLYARSAHAFDEQDRQHAMVLAAQCSAALTVILRQADQALLRGQLAEAMDARSVIDQALGIVMAQQHCTATEAFELLRRASSSRNRRLREIAADLINSVTGQPPQPPAPFHER